MPANNAYKRFTFFMHDGEDRDLIAVLRALPYRGRSQFLRDAVRFYLEHSDGPRQRTASGAARKKPADHPRPAAPPTKQAEGQAAAPATQPPPARPSVTSPASPADPTPSFEGAQRDDRPKSTPNAHPEAERKSLELDRATLESMQHLVSQF